MCNWKLEYAIEEAGEPADVMSGSNDVALRFILRQHITMNLQGNVYTAHHRISICDSLCGCHWGFLVSSNNHIQFALDKSISVWYWQLQQLAFASLNRFCCVRINDNQMHKRSTAQWKQREAIFLGNLRKAEQLHHQIFEFHLNEGPLLQWQRRTIFSIQFFTRFARVELILLKSVRMMGFALNWWGDSGFFLP